MKRVFFPLVIFLTALLVVPSSFGQELASLTGVVSDNTGAVIPGASVTLTDTRTNANYKTETNSVGAYVFVKLLPGPGYKLTLNKDGFETLTISKIYVGVGTTTTQNGQMQLGKVTETVEVSGTSQPVTLDTTDATVGNNFDMRMVHELPIQNRDSPTALLALQPGVIASHASSDDPISSRDGAITGARTDQSNVTLDGLDVNDFATGQSFATVGNAPVDSVQEFRGETANPLASSGRGSGGQIQLTTQSGSNQWHGALYEYHRNTITEANSFFNARAGLPAPQLIRNQFGAKIGGPLVKDKLFFFFNYQGRREAREASVLTTVPLDNFRNGMFGYINDSPGCNSFSRINSTPSCVSFVDSAGIAAMDPTAQGVNSALLAFINGRYPHANDLSVGDGVNTGGFRFNSPVPRSADNYVGRVDYTLSDTMKLFGRVSIVRDDGADSANGSTVQFPGDPITHRIIDHSYAYVIGNTWTVSPTKVNNFIFGETRSDLNFPTTFNPVGTSVFSAFGPLSSPYSEQSAQHRVVPIPVFRDDFTWLHGRHNFQMGGTFKPIKTRSLLLRDLNFVSLGLGGFMNGLDSSQIPADILQSTGTANDPDPQGVAITNWSNAFPFILGRYASIFSRYDNQRDLSPYPQGTGYTRHYRYYETEAYFQDTWRVRDDLTLTYGLRYQYYSVPYEADGFEVIPNLNLAGFYNPRVAIGITGDFTQVPPLLSYSLGGKANHAGGLYGPDWKDFAPRLAFAYNPAMEKGFLGKFLGSRKSVIRGGAGIVFDHPATNAINFIQDQSNVFQSSVNQPFGVLDPSGFEDPVQSLIDDPRFTNVNSIPPPLPAPATFTPPDDGTINGAAANYAVDRGLRTPYSIVFSLGVERELPGNFLVEANYFGRLGRRLLALADGGQFVDFQDIFTPGHSLAGDFYDLTKQMRAGVDPSMVTPEPFFEDYFGAGVTSFFAGSPFYGPLFARGDLTDTVSFLSPFLPSGIGLAPQFGTNGYITNKSSSSYNGLLMTLHKRLSHGLQFDVNYTYSHSIDNLSAPANNVFGTFNFSGGLICDITRLRACRGNSDFDATHIISGNFIYELPFGRGKQFAAGLPGWAEQVVGGWQISGIPSWRTGFAFTTVSGAFPISFYNNAPAIFVGKQSDIKTHIHLDPATGIQIFANQANAIDAFRGPLGLEGGSRNNLRGPAYTNLDLGVAKHFSIGERYVVEFRADAYNVFNHVNFGLPGTGGSGGTADITDPSSFGVINTAAAPRQVQFALRLDF